MKINAVIFDIDNTLYSEVEYFIDAVSEFNKLNKHVGDIRFIFKNGFRDGSTDILRDILTHFDLYSVSNHNMLFNIYQTVNSSIKIDSDVKNTFDYLRKKKIKIGILTNGVGRVQRNKFKCLELDKYVDCVVYAKEINKEKPEKESFDSICNMLNVKNNRALMVGDSYKNDIQGAINAGMNAILIKKYLNTDIVNSYKYSFASIYEGIKEFIYE